MSYSFLYTAAALLGLITPMDQALMSALENPALERGGAAVLPPPAPLRPKGGRWRIEGDAEARALHAGRRPSGYTLHLASYLGETWAQRGWAELRRRTPLLAEREPAYRRAEVPALGPVVRLTVGDHASLAEAAAACGALRPAVDYCAPLPLFE